MQHYVNKHEYSKEIDQNNQYNCNHWAETNAHDKSIINNVTYFIAQLIRMKNCI